VEHGAHFLLLHELLFQADPQVNPAARDGGAAASSSSASTEPEAVVRAAERRKAAMVAAAAGLAEIERLRHATHGARYELQQAEAAREKAKADLRALEVKPPPAERVGLGCRQRTSRVRVRASARAGARVRRWKSCES
jgi:multidrug resistance efflux pump